MFQTEYPFRLSFSLPNPILVHSDHMKPDLLALGYPGTRTQVVPLININSTARSRTYLPIRVSNLNDCPFSSSIPGHSNHHTASHQAGHPAHSQAPATSTPVWNPVSSALIPVQEYQTQSRNYRRGGGSKLHCNIRYSCSSFRHEPSMISCDFPLTRQKRRAFKENDDEKNVLLQMSFPSGV